MSLINKNSFYALLKQKVTKYAHGSPERNMLYAVMGWLKKHPNLDAVPVVRCKNCVYAVKIEGNAKNLFREDAMNCNLCRGDGGHGISGASIIYPNDFCSDGVRREEND